MAAMTEAGVKMVVKDLGKFKSDLRTAAGALRQVADNLDTQADKATTMRQRWDEVNKTMQQVAPYMLAAGAALGAVVVKTTMTAARTQELRVVLEQIAKQTGNSILAVNNYEQAIKDLGIRTQVADELLIQFMRYNLDAADAVKLARVAQDAAVISMQDSSDALSGLLHGIITYNTRVLRTYGVTVNLGQAFRDWAKANDTTMEAMTGAQKQQVALNEVLAQGEVITGTYEAAMGTAGKQLRSMRRYAEEAANEFGKHMLPVMLEVLLAGRDLLKAFQGLSEGTQSFIIQFAALNAVLITAGGAIAFIIPKLAALAAVIGVTSLALFAAGGLIAALGALVIVIANAQKASRDETREITEISLSYEGYTERMRNAGKQKEILTEETWDLVKAQEAEGEAVDAIDYKKAEKELAKFVTTSIAQAHSMGATGDIVKDSAEIMEKKFIPRMNDAEIQVAQLKDTIIAMAKSMDMTDEEAAAFAAEVAGAAGYMENFDFIMQDTMNTMATLGAVQHEYTEVAEESGQATIDQAEAMGELEAAIEELQEKYEDFYGTLAEGIVDFRELGEKSKQSAKDYKEALRDLRTDAAESYDDIKAKYENSLPDATSVQERTGMILDAWDEWALRMGTLMDDVMTDQEANWLTTIQSMTAGTEFAFMEQEETVQGWMERLKTAFYEGKLPPEFYNEDTRAWQQHAAEVEAAMVKETNAVAREAARKRKVLEEERQKELQAEREARNRSLLELSLTLAEQTGLLQQWSKQRFGPDFSHVADSADEVLALLDAGILDIDSGLERLLTTTTAGVQNALDTTGSAAEETKAKLDEIVTTDWAEKQRGVIEQALDMEGLLPEEDIRDMMASVGIAIEEEIPPDPFDFLGMSFETNALAIQQLGSDTNHALISGLEEFDVANATALQSVAKNWADTTKGIADLWVGSKTLIPDLKKGISDLEDKWKTSLDKMQDRLVKPPDGFIPKTDHEFHIMATSLKLEIQGIIDKINEIPKFIKIVITYEEGENPLGDFDNSSVSLSQAPVQATAAYAPIVNINASPTINNAMDAASFQWTIEQAVMSALRT